MLKQQTLKIGITGGIGSGKTTVCKIFETLGIPVYYADDSAKWLMQNDVDLMNQIKELFGADVYDEQSQLNRATLAKIVFNDKTALKKLENLVHPAVHLHGEKWFAKQQNAPYALKEAALIFESGSHKHLDGVITVFAPEALRIKRVMERDDSTAEQIKARINKQMPEAEKLALADYIIYNDEQQMLIPQIISLHRKLIEKQA